MQVTLEPHSGTIRGLALILSIDDNAVQILSVDIKPIPLQHASKVELDIVPMFDTPTHPDKQPDLDTPAFVPLERG